MKSDAPVVHDPSAGLDGITPASGGLEYAQAAKDMLTLRKHYKPGTPMPKKLAARRATFLYHFDNRWDIENHLQTIRWNTEQHLMKYYKALKGTVTYISVESLDGNLEKDLVGGVFERAIIRGDALLTGFPDFKKKPRRFRQGFNGTEKYRRINSPARAPGREDLRPAGIFSVFRFPKI